MAIFRGAPCNDRGSSLPYNGISWQNQVNEDLVGLWNRVTCLLSSIGGTGNAITAVSTPTIPSYVEGMSFWLVPTADSTSTSITINIDTQGVKNVKNSAGNAPSLGALATGNLYKILYYSGEFRIVFRAPVSTENDLPFMYKKGFKISVNALDSNNDVDIALGVARDSADQVNIIGNAMTKRMDAVWSVGDNNGCMLQSANLAGTITITTNTSVTGSSTTFTTDFQVGDVITSVGGQSRRITVISSNTSMTVESAWTSGETGVTYKRGGKARNTNHRLFAAYKDSDGTVDYVCSPRDVPVDMPAGYTYTRRIGNIFTDASANNRPWNQLDDTFLLSTPFNDIGISGGGGGTHTMQSLVHPNVTAIYLYINGVGSSQVWKTMNDAIVYDHTSYTLSRYGVPLSSASQWKVTIASGGGGAPQIAGWTDNWTY